MTQYNELPIKGKTIVSFTGLDKDSVEVIFTCSDGTQYRMYHNQNCCESVYLEDICGDPQGLLNTPVVDAFESEECIDSDLYEKYTFYRFVTFNTTVVLRWYGESNGYYSVDVIFEEM